MLMFASVLSSPLHAEPQSEKVSSLAQHFSAGAPPGESDMGGEAEIDAGYSLLRAAEEDNRRLLALCIMGTAILALAFVLSILNKRGASPESIVAGSGLVLVIFATVLVATLAKSDQQLTAPIGILGAIAGYLFGKTAKGTEADQKPEKAGST
ncbi:MAG TPA: hypothetical protein PKD12_12745 [Nitrospira sp.]|nr:hypothetical protein [Nitrospira sp.]